MQIKTNYFKKLDIIRAVAVLLVLSVHCDPYIFNFGWIGVTIFFVLSGFLITNILIKNKTEERYFSTFYLRRALRILPIYYLVLIICFLWGVLVDSDVSHFFYYLFYLQSIPISHEWTPIFSNGLMGHTWSLSVEQIFYLVWPLVVFYNNRNNLVRIAVAVIFLSIIYKFYQAAYGTEIRALLSINGNLDSLMAGAILSIHSAADKKEISNRHKTKLLLISFSTLILIMLQFTLSDLQVLINSKILLGISAAWLAYYIIYHVVTQKSNDPVFLPYRILIYIGEISYGIYLYHIPVYQFFASFLYHYKIELNPVIGNFIKIGITIMTASFSWYLIERPILRLKDRFTYLRNDPLPRGDTP